MDTQDLQEGRLNRPTGESGINLQLPSVPQQESVFNLNHLGRDNEQEGERSNLPIRARRRIRASRPPRQEREHDSDRTGDDRTE